MQWMDQKEAEPPNLVASEYSEFLGAKELASISSGNSVMTPRTPLQTVGSKTPSRDAWVLTSQKTPRVDGLAI